MLNIRINRKGVKILRFKASQKAAFGFGAFGKDVVYMLVATYLLYYYNVVLGISSVFVGTVMM
ncbi:MAG: MFS transporter, partial [Agathobacter sp.]|nr:MFS transporter [Agathobacter sp.]